MGTCLIGLYLIPLYLIALALPMQAFPARGILHWKIQRRLVGLWQRGPSDGALVHHVLGAGQAAGAVAQAPPLEVAVLLEFAHARADGVDALAVYTGQPLERVVPPRAGSASERAAPWPLATGRGCANARWTSPCSWRSSRRGTPSRRIAPRKPLGAGGSIAASSAREHSDDVLSTAHAASAMAAEAAPSA